MEKSMIKADKCVVGETYYLTGMWWDYYEPKCLINTPVKFIGRDKSISNRNKSWYESKGQFVFEMLNDTRDKVHAYAKDDLFKEPYSNEK